MEILSYDICLLIIKASSKNFGIAELQTDNIFNVGIEVFINKKEAKIIKVKFKAKLQIIWEISILRDFNSWCMIIKAKFIIVI